MNSNGSGETLVAFLAQPVKVIAREGEDFAEQVITMLRRWRSERGDDVVREREGIVFVLSPEPHAAWSVVVVSHGEADGFGGRAQVCAVGFGPDFSDVRRFEAFGKVRHFCPVMEVTLGDLMPPLFGLLAPDHGEAHDRRRPSLRDHRSLRREFVSLMDRAHYWRSARVLARGWGEMLDEARRNPLIVGDVEDEQVVVFSRPYLEELLEPTSARALARRYAAHALDAGGLIDVPEVPAEELGALPGIAPS